MRTGDALKDVVVGADGRWGWTYPWLIGYAEGEFGRDDKPRRGFGAGMDGRSIRGEE
jgi:hypothetical protein